MVGDKNCTGSKRHLCGMKIYVFKKVLFYTKKAAYWNMRLSIFLFIQNTCYSSSSDQ